MPSNTNKYHWSKPDPLGSQGAWGGILNGTIDDIDHDLELVDNKASAALPKVGGVMTGRVDLKTGTMAVQSVTGATPIDLAVAQYLLLAPTGPVTLSFTNVPAAPVACAVVLEITDGGSKVTWPSGVKWGLSSLNAAPALTAGAGKSDLLVIVTHDGGTTWRGFVVDQGFA